MSTILDALKKLEAERAAAARGAGGTPQTAAAGGNDFIIERGRGEGRFSPGTIAGIAGVLLMCAVAASLLTAYLLGGFTSPAPEAMNASQVASAPSPAPPMPGADETAAAAPRDNEEPAPVAPEQDAPGETVGVPARTAAERPATSTPTAVPRAAASEQAPAAVPPVESTPMASEIPSTPSEPTAMTPEASAPETPAPQAIQEETAPSQPTDTSATGAPQPPPRPAPSAPAAEPEETVIARADASGAIESSPRDDVKERVAALVAERRAALELEREQQALEQAAQQDDEPGETPSVPDDISSLPILGQTQRIQYGLTDVRLSMPRPTNDYNKHPAAVFKVNGQLQTVHVGETIPGSRARLIGVELQGVAVQGLNDSLQFYMAFW